MREVVVFRYRYMLQNHLPAILCEEFKWFRQTGELREPVRIIMQAIHDGIGYLNDKGLISHCDVSPSNIFIQGCPEDLQLTVVLADLGTAVVHPLNYQTSAPVLYANRQHSTMVHPEKHEAQVYAKKRKDPSSSEGPSKAKDEGFTFWTRLSTMNFFNKEAEEGRLLKSLRGGTPPLRDLTVKNMNMTPRLGQHIDLFALVRMLLWYLAPVSKDEGDECWDKLAREASVSTDAMGAFIASRIPDDLRADHPRQPLMWQRLLDYLVKGLQPFSLTAGLKLSDFTTCLFLSMPILSPADDRLLATGGFIEVPGGDLYGTGIHETLLGKRIESVLICFKPGKGLSVVTDKAVDDGGLLGIYVASCVSRLDHGIDSRFTVSHPGCEDTDSEPQIFVTRFTPKMNFRYYIEKKKATGAFMNAPNTGERENSKLDRARAWNDTDVDLGHQLKIFPILATRPLQKGEEVLFKYNPKAARRKNFPVD